MADSRCILLHSLVGYYFQNDRDIENKYNLFITLMYFQEKIPT